MNLILCNFNESLLFDKNKTICNCTIQCPASYQWKESALCLTDVIDLHIYKLKSNLNCLNIVKCFSVAMCNYWEYSMKIRSASGTTNGNMKGNQRIDQRIDLQHYCETIFHCRETYFIYGIEEGFDHCSLFSFLRARAPQIFPALWSSVCLKHGQQHNPYSLTSSRCGCLVLQDLWQDR